MKFKLGSWPFPYNAPARLLWVKSPLQVGEYKQWQQKVLFGAENGQLHVHTLPWGTIPSLKLGEVYVNGSVSDLTPVGIVKDFTFGADVNCRVISTDSLKNPWVAKVREYCKELVWERCACIESNSVRLWIPCVEIARAFFAINKQMAYLLLEPGGLTKVCTSELKSGRVKIDFNRSVPLASLNQVLVTRIATVLYHSHWWDSWQQVWNRSIKHIGDSNAYSQLFCCPPIIKHTSWTVRGIQYGNDFFVFEVKEFRTSSKLPFTEVSYTHPNLTISVNDGNQSEDKNNADGGNEHNGNKNKVGEIGTDIASPSNHSNPLRGSVTASSITFGNNVKVSKRFAGERPAKDKSNSPEPQAEKCDSESNSCIPVSMNGEAGIGEFRAAEFRPIEMLESIPPGLKPFLGAVAKITRSTVGCTIEQLPDDSPLSKLGNGHRHFALAHIINDSKDEGYALEIDSSDGQRLSTIIFKPTSGTEGLKSAKKLLVNCLSKQGHWTLEAIKGNITVGYKLAKHSNLDPVSWGHRLRTKIKLLDLKDTGI